MAPALSLTRRPLAISLTLLFLSLGFAHRVRAQDEDPERAQEAAARFDRGVELYSEGSLDAALVQFERAYELVPDYRVLYNLAQVQAERHEYVAALGLFQRYLREGNGEIADVRREETVAQIEQLAQRIARLSVESNVPDAKLFVDDELVATLPLATPVLIDSGVRTLRVEAPGRMPALRKLKVAGGDETKISIPLRERVDGAVAQGAREVGPPSYRPMWIASATAVALAGATLTTGLLARSANRDLDAELGRFGASEKRLRAQRATVRTRAGLTDGLAIATAIAVGVAVYYLIDPPHLAPEQPARARPKVVRALARMGELGLHAEF